MARKSGTNQESLENSRALLLAAARAEFLENGYANASTNRIVEKSGMARGSLYYHFTDKQGLFREIFDELSQEALIKITQRMKLKNDPWEAFVEGCLTYIDCAKDPSFRSIVLMDALNAIPYTERINIMRKSMLGALMEAVKGLIEKGVLPNQDPSSMTFMIYGMLAEIGRSFAFNPDLDKAHTNARATLTWALEALKQNSK